jgi:hypothetical protein
MHTRSLPVLRRQVGDLYRFVSVNFSVQFNFTHVPSPLSFNLGLTEKDGPNCQGRHD